MRKGAHKQAWYLINGITLYRVVAAPFLLVLLFTGYHTLFKWLLAVSFFTDLVDGYLARKYKVTSILGTKLDSIGDDLTIVVAFTALVYMKWAFIKQQQILFLMLLFVFLFQSVYALIRYGKITSFHTYLAKAAALLQGVFLLLFFFTGEPCLFLFYTAAGITIIELIEEAILVRLLPRWEANVKGLYWVLKKKKHGDD